MSDHEKLVREARQAHSVAGRYTAANADVHYWAAVIKMVRYIPQLCDSVDAFSERLAEARQALEGCEGWLAGTVYAAKNTPHAREINVQALKELLEKVRETLARPATQADEGRQWPTSPENRFDEKLIEEFPEMADEGDAL